jgi:pyruvate carboxylase
MRVAMDAVLETDAICEPAICYTGDLLNPDRPKYSIKYYVELAKELEKMGAHLLAIKDMAGLCKPYAAEQLVRALKQEIGIPIHFHTHDISGLQSASLLKAADVKVDVVDAAIAAMAGGTSQPNLNTLVESLRFTPRDSGLDADALDQISHYWHAVRRYYAPFETEVLPATADMYRYEMPGGQYSNLFHQAIALGLADRWPEVCRAYAEVNQVLGDIVKVTPTSKAVGDFALFMVANNLTARNIESGTREFAFPESVVDLLSGRMGQPPGGFPKKLQKRILRDAKPLAKRPGETLRPADFDEAARTLEPQLGRPARRQDVLSYLLYPKVFEEFVLHERKYSDTSELPTPAFFFGLAPGEEITVEIEPGKTLLIKFLTVGDPHPDGSRTVFFELNGQPRDLTVVDHSLEPEAARHPKADPNDPCQIGASMPGMIVAVPLRPGDAVARGQKLLSMEAMKMESSIYSDRAGKVGQVFVKPGSTVETGDLLLTLE